MLYNIYFSATGRTKNIADIICRKIADCGPESLSRAVDIDLSKRDFDGGDYAFTKGDLRIVSCSVFGGRMPRPASRRLATLKGSGAAAIPVAVFGNRAVDDRLAEMGDILVRSGFVPVAGAEAVASHSIINSVARDRPDRRDKKEIEDFAADIAKKLSAFDGNFFRYMTGKTLTLPGNRPYTKAMNIPFKPRADKNCTPCGLCRENCPVGAISAENPKVTDKSKCITCMRCVDICPRHARRLSPFLMKLAAPAMEKSMSERKPCRFYKARDANS